MPTLGEWRLILKDLFMRWGKILVGWFERVVDILLYESPARSCDFEYCRSVAQSLLNFEETIFEAPNLIGLNRRDLHEIGALKYRIFALMYTFLMGAGAQVQPTIGSVVETLNLTLTDVQRIFGANPDRQSLNSHDVARELLRMAKVLEDMPVDS